MFIPAHPRSGIFADSTLFRVLLLLYSSPRVEESTTRDVTRLQREEIHMSDPKTASVLPSDPHQDPASAAIRSDPKAKTITIKLSDRAPVLIVPTDWPVIAKADTFHGSGIACQANEESELRVRRHADGRSIVYGWRTNGPGGMPAGYRSRYAGCLLPAEGIDIALVIQRVASEIGEMELAAECIADLPAEPI